MVSVQNGGVEQLIRPSAKQSSGEQFGKWLATAITAGSFIWGCWAAYKDWKTELAAGYTVKVCLPEHPPVETATGHTVLVYRVVNPGPATVENARLQVVVDHDEEEDISNWLDVISVGPADLETKSSGQRTKFNAIPYLNGNLVQVDPGTSFGIRLVADRVDWEPNDVRASWGGCEDISAADELRLEEHLDGSWGRHLFPWLLFSISLIGLGWVYVRSWLKARKSEEYDALSKQISEVSDRLSEKDDRLSEQMEETKNTVAIARTDPEAARHVLGEALKAIERRVDKEQESSAESSSAD